MEIPYHKLFNKSVERVILASLIFQPEFVEEFESEIGENDFYFQLHKDVFKAMMYLHHNKKIISIEMIKENLGKKNRFDETEFVYIVSEMPVSKLEYYITELRNRSIKRELIYLAKEIENGIYNQDMESQELLNFVEKSIYAIGHNSNNNFKNNEEIVEITSEYIEKMKNRTNKELVGIDTGFKVLNKMTTGFNPGDLIILAARPSVGKTALALSFVYTALKNDDGVAFFSLEMPVEQLMLRLLSIDSGIELQKIRTGVLEENEYERTYQSLKRFETKPLFVDDDGGININQLRSKLRKLKNKNPKLSFAVIDYLQIMNSVGAKDRQAEISEISRNLKLLARELKIPILALSQLNRSLESRTDKRPIMSDIRESGSIEQDADIILFVYRDDVYRKKAEKEQGEKSIENEPVIVDTELIVAKQRNGPTGTVKLSFHKHLTKFSDYQNTGMITPEEQKPTRISFSIPESRSVNMYNSNIEEFDMPQF